MQSLVCPKCQGQMRTYERSGVTVDQCGECRGIFLDRGELERLVDAENAFHGGGRQAPPPQQQPRYDDRRYDDRDRDRRYDNDRDRKYYDNDRRYDNQYHHKKKKKSFLDELFD